MDITTPESLFSPTALKLGQIHYRIMKAAGELHDLCFSTVDAGASGKIKRNEWTSFGREVGTDIIHWWVFKRENAIEELRKKTNNVLIASKKLKDESSKLKNRQVEKYNDLISLLSGFIEKYAQEIDVIYGYVDWMYQRDRLCPAILFSYRVWSDTRRADRYFDLHDTTIENIQAIKRLVEIVIGLYQRDKHIAHYVHFEMGLEQFESVGYDILEQGGTPVIEINEAEMVRRTARRATEEMATYFELIRNSFQNILIDIDKYTSETELMNSNKFWASFISYAMSQVTTETQLWDFKETFDMWHAPKGQIKYEKTIKFCELVAGFANSRGAVIIVGITDSPRKVVGISELENKLKHTRQAIERYIEPKIEFTRFRQIILTNDIGEKRTCLLIIIAQTKEIMAVKDNEGRYSYPIRLETGLDRVDRNSIATKKMNVWNTNHEFVQELYRLTKT